MALLKWNARNNISIKEKQILPLSPEIRKFISNSRTYQTLFANIEGYYKKKIFNMNFENDLLIFIEKTLYDSKSYCTNSENIIDFIFKKIISLKTNYSNNKEVHLAVIWVYYFVYKTKETKSTALFKVFMSEDKAIFISPQGVTFKTWDSYIENPFLPHSFFCVPEHGIYSFIENNSFLKLNYFVAHNSNFDDNIVFKPYSQRIIIPLLENIRSSSPALQSKIAKLWIILKSWYKKIPLYIWILGAKYCISYYIKGEFKFNLETFREELIMLRNITNSNDTDINILSFDILRAIIGCFVNPKEIEDSNLNFYFSLLREIITRFSELQTLDCKNYQDIVVCLVDVFCIIIREIPFRYLIFISPKFRFIGILTAFISNKKEFIDLFNKRKNRETQNEVNNMAIKEENNKNKIIEVYNNDFDSKLSTGTILKWHEQQQNIVDLADKVLSLRTFLINDSNSEELEKIVENFCTKICQCNEPLQEWNILNQPNNKKWVFLWSNPETGDHLYHFIENDFFVITEIIGKNYLLKPVESKRYDVIDAFSHETIGVVIDLLNNFFIGLFVKNAVTIHDQCCE